MVAKSKGFLEYSYHPSWDPLRDPAALLSWEGSLFNLNSNQFLTRHTGPAMDGNLAVGR